MDESRSISSRAQPHIQYMKEELRILLQEFSAFLFQQNIYSLFPKLVIRLTYDDYVSRPEEQTLLEQNSDPSLPYLWRYRLRFQEINDLDYSMGDCRTYGRRIARHEFLHKLISRLVYGNKQCAYVFQVLHNRLLFFQPPISSKRQGRRICQLLTKIFECLLGYNLSAFEPPMFGAKPRALTTSRGNLIH